MATVGLISGGRVAAHHSYAMFEQREVVIQGTVKAFEWTNPHIFVQVLVPTAKGAPEEWSIEGTGPGQLAREGWKFSTLKVGDKVTVGVAPLKSGQKGGGLIFVQKAGGPKLPGGPLAHLDAELKGRGGQP